MKLLSWFRSIFQRTKVESEMDAELRFHMESYAADLVRSGVPEHEALRRARMEFGNVESRKEDCRAGLGLRLWDELRGDLVYGARMLRQSPGFTAVAVISLALGIGANTAIFTMANDVLYRSLALPNSDRLRILNHVRHPKTKIGPSWGNFFQSPSGEMMSSSFPYPLYLNLRSHLTVMEDLVAFKDEYGLNANAGSETESIDGQLVSGNFYHALGAKVIAGRPITESDNLPTSAPVAMISDAYWLRRFNRSADALGKVINVNMIPATIIGVNSPEFEGAMVGRKPEIFLPITLESTLDVRAERNLITDASFWWVSLIGRLKPGIPPAAAQAATEAEFHRALRATLPDKPAVEFPGLLLTEGNRGLDLQTRAFARPLHLLLTVAGLVLLMACVNLANLLLARSSSRQREISVRLAMGASRFRIFRQALTESMLLAALGGLAGLTLGYVGRNAIPSLFEDKYLADVLFDWKVFAFAVGMTLLTGLLFGIAPALRLNSSAANNVLKETTRMSRGGSRSLFGKSLVVFQVGLSVVLLVGAGLFVRTLANLRSVPLGFNPQRLLLFSLDPPRARYKGPGRIAAFHQIEEKLSALPGVQSAAVSSTPLIADAMSNVCINSADKNQEDYPWKNKVGARFFETVEIPIVMGRGFNWHDNQHAPAVAVINRKLAAKFFPNTSPIGQTIQTCGEDAKRIEIVGVAANAKYAGIDEETPTMLYLPYLQQEDADDVTFEIKTAASTESVVKLIRAAVASVDRDLPMLDIRTQTQQIDATISQQRLFASLTSAFGLLALLLAGIGIDGIMAYNVSRRTNEIGIRMALGARARSVLAMILREAWLLSILGTVVGIAGALALTRLLKSELFGIKPNDPLTYCAAGVILLVIALLAGALPARRAATIDPCEALRHE